MQQESLILFENIRFAWVTSPKYGTLPTPPGHPSGFETIRPPANLTLWESRLDLDILTHHPKSLSLNSKGHFCYRARLPGLSAGPECRASDSDG